MFKSILKSQLLNQLSDTIHLNMQEHPEARYIVETLGKAGFIAYYAGGWVRDYLLKHPSDDIDIATNAPPDTIQALFEKTVPIGIAFGIVLVIVNGKDYEVATFRQDFDYHDGRRPNKIEFTTAEEDAKRRDFTINGMFYDPIKEKVLDYVEGRLDLEKKIIRAIGNPHLRIKEDRLRMVRAIRFGCRFSFAIEETTADAIRAHAKELFPSVAIERVVQELEKGLAFHKLPSMLLQLHDFGLLAEIFPPLAQVSIIELEHRIQHLAHIPQNAPLIAFLLPLFPNFILQDGALLCKKLKLSNDQLRFLELIFQAKKLNSEAADLYSWAHFYARPHSLLALHATFADVEKHLEQKKLLEAHIKRIQKGKPIVTSLDLKAVGIVPGKEMGRLLQEAEKIAINQGIEDKLKILKKILPK